MSSSIHTFLTQRSLRFIVGDRVTAGVIFNNQVHTFHATTLSFTAEAVPYNPDEVVATFSRELFLDGDDFPEDIEQYLAPFDEETKTFVVPETGNMKQITHWTLEVDPSSKLPFDVIPDQYLPSEGEKEGEEKEEGKRLRVPANMIVGRMLSDEDITPTFDCHIGRKIKARTYVKNNKVSPPRKDHIEVIGTIVDFEFSDFGVPRYIVKVQSHTSSDPENVKLKTLPPDAYKTLHVAYPNSQFIYVDNDYKSTLGPEKIDNYHVEYLRALKRIIPGALVEGVFKEAIDKTKDFWYGFTERGNYITPLNQTLKVSTDPETLLTIDVIDKRDGKKDEKDEKEKVHRVVPKPKAGDILFGYEIKPKEGKDEKNDKNDKKEEKELGKAIHWFNSRAYPGFAKFFEYLRNDKLPKPENSKEGKERAKKAIDSMKAKGSPTMYSALVAGYYDSKLKHQVIQNFKKRYLWYVF